MENLINDDLYASLSDNETDSNSDNKSDNDESKKSDNESDNDSNNESSDYFANEFLELKLYFNNNKILIGYFHNALLDFYFRQSYFLQRDRNMNKNIFMVAILKCIF